MGRDTFALGVFDAKSHRPMPEVRCRRITGVGVAVLDGRAMIGLIDSRLVSANLTEDGYAVAIPGMFSPTGQPIELAVGAHAESIASHGPAAFGLVPTGIPTMFLNTEPPCHMPVR